MRVQNIGLVLSAIILFIGIILNDMIVSIVAFLGIALSGWGFVYPDRANVWIYKVQSNFAKDKLEKEWDGYQQELMHAQAYISKFATMFNAKFPLRWTIDYHGNIIPATINELTESQLKEPFHHFQELLYDEGIRVPDYLIKLAINHKIDTLRYQEFEEYFNSKLEGKVSPYNAIKVYAQQIGTTTEEIHYINKTFTIEYLVQYLRTHFSKEDIALQVGFNISESEKAKSNMQATLQEFAKEIERDRRVNMMRGILHGKIMPSAHKNCNEWSVQGSKVMEDDLKELFGRMGYDSKETSTKEQGTDFIIKKLNKKIAVKFNFVIEGSVGMKAIQEAYAGKTYWDCDACIVIANAVFSKEAQDLAHKLQVELWDETTMQKLLDKYWNQDVEYWALLKADSRKTRENDQKETDQIVQRVSHVN